MGYRGSKIVRFVPEVDDSKSESGTSESSSFLDQVFDPEQDYDFDVDDDLMASTNQSNTKLPICEHLYLAACQRYGLIPIKNFIHQLACTRITLTNVPLGEPGARAIAVSLVRNHTVDTLELSGDDLGPRGAEHIAEVMMESISVKTLDLSDNNIGSDGALAMANLLKTNRYLTSVNLSGNGFDEDDAAYFADMLLQNNTLEELDLSYNNLCTRGGVALKTALAENCSLRVLNLRWNHLRKHGALGVADGLKLNVGLRKLDVAWNGFGIEGCYYLSRALEENRTLKDLDVSANRIGMLAIKFLLKGLTRNATLETLRIGVNPLTTDAAIYLLQALGKAEESVITTLDLTNIQVDGVFLHVLKELQEKRQICVTHGMVLRQEKTKRVSKEDVIDEDDPLSVLFEFMRQKNLRLKDLFGVFDKDGSECITRREFAEGFKKNNIPLSRRSLEILMSQLDKDGNGSVDFSELWAGQRENNRKRLMQKMKKKKKGGKQKDPQEVLRLKVQGYLTFKEKKEKAERQQLALDKEKQTSEQEAEKSLGESSEEKLANNSSDENGIGSSGIGKDVDQTLEKITGVAGRSQEICGPNSGGQKSLDQTSEKVVYVASLQNQGIFKSRVGKNLELTPENYVNILNKVDGSPGMKIEMEDDKSQDQILVNISNKTNTKQALMNVVNKHDKTGPDERLVKDLKKTTPNQTSVKIVNIAGESNARSKSDGKHGQKCVENAQEIFKDDDAVVTGAQGAKLTGQIAIATEVTGYSLSESMSGNIRREKHVTFKTAVSVHSITQTPPKMKKKKKKK